jgi:ATP-binding cassette subfamily F protein 3
MDEPTTHLDLVSVEALVAALEQYQGTLIFISHDVYFIRAIANHVVHVKAGRLTHYPGDYQYYVDKTAAAQALNAPPPVNGNTSPSELADKPSNRAREQKRFEAEQRQARYQQRKAKQEIVDALEAEIAALEQRQAELTAELESANTYATPGRGAEITRELVGVVQQLTARTGEWEAAASQLAELE